MKHWKNRAKGKYFLSLIGLLLLFFEMSSGVYAQFAGNIYGKTVVGKSTTSINGNLLLKSTAELYLGAHNPQGLQTNTLILNGNYNGENGSKIYLSVTDNSNLSGSKGFVDIFGTANQSVGATEIILDMFNGWNGVSIDLIRANKDNSDANTFCMEETRYGDYTAVLLHRTEGNSLIWYISPKEEITPPSEDCLDIVHQKLNNTLVVNNNPATNGGYEFAYYSWYKNGKKITEGSHDDLYGHYYTGGNNLDHNAEYWVEVIDQKGDKYRSCSFTPTIQTLMANVCAYPNPVKANHSHTVTVEIDGIEHSVLQTATIDVFSILGTHIGKIQVNGRSQIPVELPKTAGVYLLKFQSETEERGIKIIVEQ